jgi:2-oxoglutarate ferredoxin oxidoreductase subunit alpha
MMEAVILPDPVDPAKISARDWTVGGMKNGRAARHITSLDLVPEGLEGKTRERFARYEKLAERECRFEETGCDDADLIIVAYGTSARVAQGARELAFANNGGASNGGAGNGPKIGLFRPVTLFPFPKKRLGEIAARGKPILVVEMSQGQLVEDVKLAIFDECKAGSAAKVHLLGHSGGVIPTEEEVLEAARSIVQRKEA